MKAAIYARTATIEQSTASQIELCREYIIEQGGQVVGIYEDPGVSGNTTDRDGLKLLMENADKYDTLVVTGHDRLFRNDAQIKEFMDGLGQLRINLVVVKKL